MTVVAVAVADLNAVIKILRTAPCVFFFKNDLVRTCFKCHITGTGENGSECKKSDKKRENFFHILLPCIKMECVSGTGITGGNNAVAEIITPVINRFDLLACGIAGDIENIDNITVMCIE